MTGHQHADTTSTTPRSDRRDTTLSERMRAVVDAGKLDLPQPGDGHTAARLGVLAELAAGDLALARLAEAHLDAVTILREAGREPVVHDLYGVWASDAPHARLQLSDSDGRRTLHGRKAFCTGAGIVDRALATVSHDDHLLLIDLPVKGPHVTWDASDWITAAFAQTNTATISVEHLPIDADQMIGPPDWYLDRTGFWHGALAPAACWAGGAIGLVDHCLALVDPGQEPDDHTLAHLGVLDAAAWQLRAILEIAGTTIDDAPTDHGSAITHAYRVRTAVESVVTEVIDHATRAFGPRLLAFDEWAALRISELQLYVRQHHDRRDHSVLGRLRLDLVRDQGLEESPAGE